MDNLLFSLNIVCPIFLLILVGAYLRRIGLFTEQFSSQVATFVFYVALPASLLRQVAGSDILGSFSGGFVLYILFSTLAAFLIGWALSALVLSEPKEIAAAAHAAYRGNYAYVGLPIIAMLTGSETVPAAVMVVAFVLPFYNVLATILFSRTVSGKGQPLSKQVLAIVKNPMIVGILLGLPFALLRFPVPSVLDTTLQYLGRCASPLGLLLIGVNLRGGALLGKWKAIALSALFKVILSPVLGTAAACLLGFRGDELAVIYVMFAVPSAVNSFVMTEKMGGDKEVGAGAVAASAILSIPSMTFGIFILRSLALL